MLYAYDDSKQNRIRPFYSGQQGICPLCDGVVVAKCGDIYVEHWAHKPPRNEDCDSWKEHETDWHRKWKERFPESWQEVVVEKNGIFHRADVKTPSGLVIEFQHSSISTSTIRTRENFYEEMIWVIDAREFKGNFRLHSVVKGMLRSIEESASNQLQSIITGYEEDLNDIERKINEINPDINFKSQTSNQNHLTVEKLKAELSNVEALSKSMIAEWLKNKDFLGETHLMRIYSQLNWELKNKFYSNSKEADRLNRERENHEKWLKEIAMSEDFEIAGQTFKIFDYKKIPSSAFNKVKGILKESRKTFFPETVSFISEQDFKSYEYRTQLYDFAVDTADVVNNLKNKIEAIDITLSSLNTGLLELWQELKIKLPSSVLLEIEKVEQEVLKSQEELAQLIKRKNFLQEQRTRLELAKDKDVSESKRQIDREKNDSRFKVMKEKKGLYIINRWKFERKSWQSTSCSTYFDIGENYLFERVKPNVFKKISIDEFVKKYSGSQ